MSDRVLVMDKGRLIYDGPPRSVGEALKQSGHNMFLSMPAPMRIFASVPNKQSCPITVRDGRLWLDEFSARHPLKSTACGEQSGKRLPPAGPVMIELRDVWFKYEKDLPDVIRGLSLKACRGEFLAILGGNGTGKTTALSLVAGINRPYRGQVRLAGEELSQCGGEPGRVLGVLPQNPQALFVKKTVRKDLLEY